MFDIGDPGRSGRTATLVFPFSRVSFYRFGSDVFWASCAAFRPPVRFPRWVDVLFRAGCVGSQYSSGSVPHCDLEKQWRFTGQTVRGYRRIHEITRNTGFPCRIASTYNRKREPSRSWWRPVSPVCWRLRTRREPNLRGPLEPYAGDVIFFFFTVNADWRGPITFWIKIYLPCAFFTLRARRSLVRRCRNSRTACRSTFFECCDWSTLTSIWWQQT